MEMKHKPQAVLCLCFFFSAVNSDTLLYEIDSSVCQSIYFQWYLLKVVCIPVILLHLHVMSCCEQFQLDNYTPSMLISTQRKKTAHNKILSGIIWISQTVKTSSQLELSSTVLGRAMWYLTLLTPFKVCCCCVTILTIYREIIHLEATTVNLCI